MLLSYRQTDRQIERQTADKNEGSQTDDDGRGKEVTVDDRSTPIICLDMFILHFVFWKTGFKSLTIQYVNVRY